MEELSRAGERYEEVGLVEGASVIVAVAAVANAFIAVVFIDVFGLSNELFY
jgi:hypothetical protein